MRNNSEDLFPSSGGDGESYVTPDLSLEDLFKNQVRQMLRSHRNATEEETVRRVETIFAVLYAQPLIQLEAERGELIRKEQICNEEAAEIAECIKSGAIPKHLENEQQHALPVSPWGKIGFFLLLLVAIGLAFSEWIYFGWFLRFMMDSFIMGLVCSSSVLVFLVIDSILIHRLSDANRRRVVVAQGIIGLISFASFVWLSIRYAEGSIFDQADTVNRLRMGCQIFTSIVFAAICLDAACRRIRKQPQVNPAFSKAKQDISNAQENASDNRLTASQIKGKIERAHAVKADVIQGAIQKRTELAILHDYQRETTNEILNDKFI